MATRLLLILTGAPDSRDLDWTVSTLVDDFQEPIARLLGLTRDTASPYAPQKKPMFGLEYAAWRLLPSIKSHTCTGFNQLRAFNPDEVEVEGDDSLTESTDFCTTAALTIVVPSTDKSGVGGLAGQELLSQFFEHSLAVHEDIPSSELRPDETGQSAYLTYASSFASHDGTEACSTKQPLSQRGGHLSDLKDIPPASHLLAVTPQTMTINLIVGIISIAQPRAVQTRWGTTKFVVEVLVGDETKSGFSITFWISSDDISQSVLAGLRSQDIVLVQNVALNIFMKKVYGSSLRKDYTKVSLLHRKRLDAQDVGGYYSTSNLASEHFQPQLLKTRRVRDWVLKFVGQGGDARPNAVIRSWDVPPPLDSQ